MHERRQSSRGAFGLPDTGQGALGAAIDAGGIFFGVKPGESISQTFHIAGCQMQALGTGGRNNVGGVPGQKHVAKTRRFGNKTAQRSNVFLRRGAGDDELGQFRVEVAMQSVPRPRVDPGFHLVVRRELRVLAYGLHLGARLPIHATSTGRVLLAGEPKLALTPG